MCGIAGLFAKTTEAPSLVPSLKILSKLLQHRGPDGEGFLLSDTQLHSPYYDKLPLASTRELSYLPKFRLPENEISARLGFVHRRLSIIDLSEGGHQPMCDAESKTWITYNGEIYNYPEIRQELIHLGFRFLSESDTEVILAAYRHWGENCVNKFNGMWAFCIYDSEKNKLFASRDRFGVKPFYYTNTTSFLAFASEQKALVGAKLASSRVQEKALHNYLVNVQLENETRNFFEDIEELWPGHNLVYNLKTGELNTYAYYSLSDHVSLFNNSLSDEELIAKIYETFTRSVQLRLRSDVEVGTCLSGGIDSSAIAVSISELTRRPFHCFTSVFRNSPLNEEYFADLVTKKTQAVAHKVEPDFQSFCSEVDELIYSQDIPIWDTSTYAQYKVMERAKNTGIKVVLDGQGADELFAGYHHHYLAMWNHFFSQRQFLTGIRNVRASSPSIPRPFIFFVKERLKQSFDLKTRKLSGVLQKEFIQAYPLSTSNPYFNDINQQLINDIYQTRLKSFLKCEDRCGMWHSVESRVPFSDDPDLIELMFSFDGNRKIQKGTSKYLLREALKAHLPKEIYERRDKKGFETPIQEWLRQLRPEMLSEIRNAQIPFVDSLKINSLNPNDEYLNKLLFRLFVYCRWKKCFGT